MLFDSLLTLDDEVALVWRNNMSPSSWLFLANRAAIVSFWIGMGIGFSNATVSMHSIYSCDLRPIYPFSGVGLRAAAKRELLT